MRRYFDKKLIGYLILFYTFVTCINIAKKSYWKINGLYGLDQRSWFELLNYNILTDWIVVILFMIIISALTKKMFEKWSDWRKILAVHLFFSFFIGYFIFFVSAFLLFVFGSFTWNNVINNMSIAHFLQVIELNFLVYFSMVGIITVYYYIKKVKNIQVERSQLEATLSKARLQALEAQIHPHFIFNTLNSISSLIDIDKEKSQEMLANFSDFFRSLLQYKDKNFISVQEELKLLDLYVSIMKVRFSDHFVFQKTVDPSCTSYLMPIMVLQPLVENALEHGYSEKHTSLKVTLEVKKLNEDTLEIRLTNNGKGLEHSQDELLSASTGLSTTYNRLRLATKNRGQFTITNLSDQKGVEVRILIPKIFNNASLINSV